MLPLHFCIDCNCQKIQVIDLHDQFDLQNHCRWKDDKNQDGNENENDIDSYTEYELGDEKPFSAFNDVIHLSERHSKFDDNLCKVLNGNGDTETEVGPECTDSSTDNFDNDGFELEEDTDCKQFLEDFFTI